MAERTLDEGGVALNYAEGPDEGPPVLLLHGVCRRWQDFTPLLGRWADHGPARVLALDFRGHGRSGRTPGAYRVVDYVSDALALVDGTTGPVCVVGHSLGAMVAAAVAAERPERVGGLVLEDPPFAMMGERIGETSYLDLFRGYRPLAGSRRPAEEVAAELAEVRLDTPGGPGPVRLGDVRDAEALRFLASCLGAMDPEVLDPILAGRWLEGYDVAGTLRRISCPTLFLQADLAAGGALPPDYADELVGLIPNATRHLVEGVGHQIHGTRPDLMSGLLGRFLSTVG